MFMDVEIRSMDLIKTEENVLEFLGIYVSRRNKAAHQPNTSSWCFSAKGTEKLIQEEQ